MSHMHHFAQSLIRFALRSSRLAPTRRGRVASLFTEMPRVRASRKLGSLSRRGEALSNPFSGAGQRLTVTTLRESRLATPWACHPTAHSGEYDSLCRTLGDPGRRIEHLERF